MDFTDHSKANTTIVTTSGQHMCHLFLCTYQQHPAHSVLTAQSQISPSLLCCEIETVERTEEKKEFDRSIKNKMSKTSQSILFAHIQLSLGMPVWEGLGRDWITLYILLQMKERERYSTPAGNCWLRGSVFLPAAVISAKSYRQEMVDTVGTTLKRERNRVRPGLTERLTASYQLLLPQHVQPFR